MSVCLLVQASPILRDFAARWQHAIEGMNQEVTRQFSDTACGRLVLQVGKDWAQGSLACAMRALVC